MNMSHLPHSDLPRLRQTRPSIPPHLCVHFVQLSTLLSIRSAVTPVCNNGQFPASRPQLSHSARSPCYSLPYLYRAAPRKQLSQCDPFRQRMLGLFLRPAHLSNIHTVLLGATDMHLKRTLSCALISERPPSTKDRTTSKWPPLAAAITAVEPF